MIAKSEKNLFLQQDNNNFAKIEFLALAARGSEELDKLNKYLYIIQQQ